MSLGRTEKSPKGKQPSAMNNAPFQGTSISYLLSLLLRV